ncbi:MAG: DUF115 domain-containing protein [Gammaproteobacteria bacterium]|nr:DUF115 domain-containing protein [Gammaproteobacteria bacterium]
MGDILNDNLNYIKNRWPGLFSKLERHKRNVTKVDYIERENQFTLRVNGKQLTSLYDRDKEARLQVGSLPENAEEIAIYGFALGDALAQCVSKSTYKIRQYIFSIDTFLYALKIINYIPIFSDEKLELIYADQAHVISTPFIVSPVCVSEADSDCINFRDEVQVALATPFIRKKFAESSEMHLEQISLNYKHIEMDADISELYSTYDGNTVVVGAGPSLDSLYSKIKSYQENGSIVVAADSAVKPLMKQGIEPDYIITLDANKSIINRLLDIELINQLTKAKLIYFPVSSEQVASNWNFRRYCAYTDFSIYDELRKKIMHSNLFVSGSVIHPAIDLAVKLGSKQIMLAGCDFSFPNNKSHADGIIVQNNNVVSHPSRREIINGRSEYVYTLPNFIVYLRDLERYIKLYKPGHVNFYNMSRDGAVIAGVSYSDGI